jgi:hypothetical protein
VEVSGQLNASAALIQNKNLDFHWAGGCWGSRGGFDSVEERKTFVCVGNRTPMSLSSTSSPNHYSNLAVRSASHEGEG